MSAHDNGMLDRIAQAEAAVAALGEQYLATAKEEIQQLQSLAKAARAKMGDNAAEVDAIFQIAHNIKGQGGSFGFDLITMVGHSLCELTRSRAPMDETSLKILDHHIRILGVIADKDIRGDGGDLGNQLIEKLKGLSRKEAA